MSFFVIDCFYMDFRQLALSQICSYLAYSVYIDTKEPGHSCPGTHDQYQYSSWHVLFAQVSMIFISYSSSRDSETTVAYCSLGSEKYQHIVRCSRCGCHVCFAEEPLGWGPTCLGRVRRIHARVSCFPVFPSSPQIRVYQNQDKGLFRLLKSGYVV